jgi:alkanesulfonate monooxygenase SsuD/methylene tetrahydromethanopterin reductase-like flavin-dependent oxidoreductase (luciferase family)
MPGGMLQWGIDIAPATGIIDKDHQRYGRAAEYVQRIKALFQNVEF